MRSAGGGGASTSTMKAAEPSMVGETGARQEAAEGRRRCSRLASEMEKIWRRASERADGAAGGKRRPDEYRGQRDGQPEQTDAGAGSSGRCVVKSVSQSVSQAVNPCDQHLGRRADDDRSMRWQLTTRADAEVG
ncbi:hypothetical protein ANO11243_021990 [Dothideomycetidae sp. 11243]|nr:hypothetical protein ANO11243_021990 [fungal sp. No.11243]